jgi:hypothetical protein
MPPLRSYLPHGAALPDPSWRVRHGVVCVVLALHLVILVGYGLLAVHPDGPASAGTVVVALALVLALAPLSRRARALAATLGLLSCSAVLVQLSHGSAVMHLHYVLVVVVVALYEDWTTCLVAIAFVLIGHLVVAGIDPGSSVADDRDPLRSTLVDLVFVLGTSVTQLVFWCYVDRARLHDSLYRTGLAELSEGRTTVEAQIRQL